MCSFPGCERIPHYTGLHARWDAERQDWVPLTEQRTRAQIRRDRADAERRNKAERIARDVLEADERDDLPMNATAFQIATAAALQALTETENAR